MRVNGILRRVLSSFLSPLLLVVDDLQWADVAFLDLIQVLPSDVENRHNLLIIHRLVRFS